MSSQQCACVWWQDDEYIAFNDIRPAAKQHILIITKAHIDSILALKPCLEDVSLGKPLIWTAGCDGWTHKISCTLQRTSEESSKKLQHLNTMICYHCVPSQSLLSVPAKKSMPRQGATRCCASNPQGIDALKTHVLPCNSMVHLHWHQHPTPLWYDPEHLNDLLLCS